MTTTTDAASAPQDPTPTAPLDLEAIEARLSEAITSGKFVAHIQGSNCAEWRCRVCGDDWVSPTDRPCPICSARFVADYADALLAEVRSLHQQDAAQREEIERLRAEVARLRHDLTPPIAEAEAAEGDKHA